MSTNTLSLDQLKQAVAVSEQIAKLEAQLAAILGGAATPKASKPAATAAKPAGKRRTMSPEARARIIAAQKARWARVRAGKPAAAPAKPAAKAKTKGKRQISPEARAKMVEAAKLRWAKIRAAAPASAKAAKGKKK